MKTYYINPCSKFLFKIRFKGAQEKQVRFHLLDNDIDIATLPCLTSGDRSKDADLPEAIGALAAASTTIQNWINNERELEKRFDKMIDHRFE